MSPITQEPLSTTRGVTVPELSFLPAADGLAFDY